MKVFLRLFSVALLATLVMAISVPVLAFNDVREGHKYQKAIDLMNNRGIIAGYEDGSFQPARSINRAEFLKIITLSTGHYDAKLTQSCFSDVPDGQWFTPFVCSGKQHGLVSGYPDGRFGPSDPIKFVEALKIVENAFKMQYIEDTPWFRGMVEAAARQNLIPLSINDFGKTMTRGETSELIARFIMLNEGNLNSFLGNKKDFRVTYETIEQNKLLEWDWLNAVNTPVITPPPTPTPSATPTVSAPASPTPQPSASAEATPTPTPTATMTPDHPEFLNLGTAPHRKYIGDGTYSVTAGDHIHLTNGIVISIESINQPDDNFVIFVHYYLNGKRLSLMPQSLGQTTELFGTSIHVNLIRPANADDRFFEMTFKSTSSPTTTQEFYDACKNAGTSDIIDCLSLSVFEPLKDESIKVDGIYRVIYPTGEDDVAQYYLNQLKFCLPHVMRKTNLGLKTEVVPFRIYIGNGKAVTTNKDGIFLPITPEDKNIILKNADACFDDIVIHELTHLVILPAFMREVVNESFAYYIEKELQNELFTPLMKVAQKGKRMVVDDVYRDPTTGVSVKFLGLSSTAKHIPVFKIEDSNGRFEPLTLGVGLNAGISTENFTKHTSNLIIHVRDVHESSPFSTTVDFYVGPPIREFISCSATGFTTNHGWKSDTGDLVSVFQFDEYNNDTKSQPGKSFNYIPLDNYLTPQYPWATYYKNFYAAGACMWREYLQQNNVGLVSAFNLVSQFQNRVVGSKDTFVQELKNLLGGGFKDIATKFGLSDSRAD